jgi:hypothetical protein
VVVTERETDPERQSVGVGCGVVGTALGRSVVMGAAPGVEVGVFDWAFTGWMMARELAGALAHPEPMALGTRTAVQIAPALMMRLIRDCLASAMSGSARGLHAPLGSTGWNGPATGG